MKHLLPFFLYITWFNHWGKRLKYRIKNKQLPIKRTGWSIHLHTFESKLLKKKWKRKSILGWFTQVNSNHKNWVGIADPFLIEFKNEIYTFFEVEVNHGDRIKGEIWASKIEKNDFQKPFKVLEKKYHLSFPNVFYRNQEYYMIPETHENKTVEIYQYKNSSKTWELAGNLKEDVSFVDTNFIELNGIFYWFTYDLTIEKTRLYYSDSLLGTWKEHNNSPVDSNRNAGSIFINNEGIWRPVQIGAFSYGEGVELRKLICLNKEEYLEEIVDPSFLFKNKGYCLDGVHHFSFLEKEKLVITDGFNDNFYKLVR